MAKNKKEPVCQKMHWKLLLLKLNSKLPTSKPGCRVSDWRFFFKIENTSGFLASSLFKWVFFYYFFFTASWTRINLCFTAWKPIGVWYCRATFGRWKTTIITYNSTVRWSNFDRRDPKMRVFLLSTEATPCGHHLKWKLTPQNPPADTMFMDVMAMVLPGKIVEDFHSFVEKYKTLTLTLKICILQEIGF